MKKILLLGSQHGNELLCERLYAYMKNHHPQLLPYCTYKLANPRARNKGVRFIESDMNRSYNGTLTTYEATRAKYITTYINEGGFDIILDLHTTVCDQPPCFILPELKDSTSSFIRASHIDRVVLLTDPIVQTSLIGTHPNVIAVEVANNQLNNKLFEMLCRDIQYYISGPVEPSVKKVYTVPGLLLKSEVTGEMIDSLINFEKTKDGYIPILVGLNSYRKTTHYLGFKATTETIITL